MFVQEIIKIIVSIVIQCSILLLNVLSLTYIPYHTLAMYDVCEKEFTVGIAQLAVSLWMFAKLF